MNAKQIARIPVLQWEFHSPKGYSSLRPGAQEMVRSSARKIEVEYALRGKEVLTTTLCADGSYVCDCIVGKGCRHEAYARKDTARILVQLIADGLEVGADWPTYTEEMYSVCCEIKRVARIELSALRKSFLPSPVIPKRVICVEEE